jgi:hypothetical protein
MILSPLDTRLFEKRVFVVLVVFDIISGLNTAFAPYLSLIILEKLGLSNVELGFVGIMLSTLQYLLSPVLFFVVLYVTCGGPLLHRIASVLISLVFGSLVGFSIGSSIGSAMVAAQLGQPVPLYFPLSSLPQHVVAQTLMGFSVLAFSDISMRWRSALPVEELQKRRPGGVTLLAVLYFVFALWNLVPLLVLILYPSNITSMPHVALIGLALSVVLGLAVAGQLVVAAGLYHGRKWGWIIAVISCASSLMIDIYALGVMIMLEGSASSLFLLLASFGGVAVGLVVLLYLLSVDVRRFFGFVNPPSKVQDEPTQTEPA